MTNFEKLMNIMDCPACDLGTHDVRVRLFGDTELENCHGRVVSPRSAREKSWLLLKYLLAHRGREVTREELLEKLWTDDSEEQDDNAARVRLSRLRRQLTPLQLNGTKGLILFSYGSYFLNPDYDIYTDEELFTELLRRIKGIPVDDPVGLELCVKALELFRGSYIEHSGAVPVLLEYRKYYDSEFAALARSTVERAAALDDESVMPLLCTRSADIIPEDEALHKSIVSFLVQRKSEVELVRHISHLSFVDGTGAKWLKNAAI